MIGLTGSEIKLKVFLIHNSQSIVLKIDPGYVILDSQTVSQCLREEPSATWRSP